MWKVGERVAREKERREVTRCTRSATPSSSSSLDTEQTDQGHSQGVYSVYLPVKCFVTFLFGINSEGDKVEGNAHAANESHQYSLNHELEE